MPMIARCVKEARRTDEDPDRAPRGRAPVRGSSQGSSAKIEHPVVDEQLAVTNVKGLVIDEQPDELAVGHVDERLTRLRGAVLALGLRQRTQLIKAVEI
jgi:hypothetical protein